LIWYITFAVIVSKYYRNIGRFFSITDLLCNVCTKKTTESTYWSYTYEASEISSLRLQNSKRISALLLKIASRLYAIKTPGAVFTLAGRRHVVCTTEDCLICWCIWVSISLVYPAVIQLYNWRMTSCAFQLLIVGMQLTFWCVF